MHYLLQILLLGSLVTAIYGCDQKNPHGEYASVDYPHVLDNSLRIDLVREDPDIVTPIGIAIDAEDRIFVLESHTHSPPEEYNGPETDKIKVFKDVNGDGELELTSVFAEGINDGMNLTFGPDGHLYVVSSQAVTRFLDYDQDGVHDSAEVILELIEPDNVYDHAALLGISANRDGWLYVSRGNTGSKAWKLVGTDSSYVKGYGDGGNVVRSRLDGSNVQEVATGFWNPFDLAFDKQGRLLLIDNDPDSRGPNRLVDVVKGGDYGYKSLYGGSGIHPYVAWNGELPGTLPYAVGLGEAPSGMLDTRHTSLPTTYQNSFLVTIWEESKIVAVHLEENEGMLSGTVTDVIQGGGTFRPVAFASDSKGNVYFTDWVIREYPNHGRGRLWKITAEPSIERLDNQSLYEEYQPGEGVRRRNLLAGISEKADVHLLEEALLSADPYAMAVAREALRKPVFFEWLKQAVQDSRSQLRLQALLVLESLDLQEASVMAQALLQDSDERVQHAALLWIGREGLVSLLPELELMIHDGRISPGLFDTYISTLNHLQPNFQKSYVTQAELLSRSIMRTMPADYFRGIVEDESLPEEIRALALTRSTPETIGVDLLQNALFEGGGAMQDAVIFFLMHHPLDGGAEVLASFIKEADASNQSKADARLALSAYHDSVLINHTELRSDVVEKSDAPFFPENKEEWIAALEDKGDVRRGRRVFFSKRAQCSSCHMHSGWGGTVGPDLTNVEHSKTLEQLLNAMLEPSAEISPEWQGWYVKTKDGKSHYGRQIDVGLQKIELMGLDGTFETFSDVESYGIAPYSLMPQGLHTQLTLVEMQDLMAFLMKAY